jgi:hypothetical protein
VYNYIIVFWLVTPCNLEVVTNVMDDLLIPNMKIDAAGTSRIVLTTYKITWYHNTQENNLNLQCHKNLKSQSVK